MGLGKSDVGLIVTWFLFGSGGPFAIAGETGAEPPPVRDGSFGGIRLGFESSETSLPEGERCSAEGVRNSRDWWYSTMFVPEGPSAERGGRADDRAIWERGGRAGLGVPLAGRGGARLRETLELAESDRKWAWGPVGALGRGSSESADGVTDLEEEWGDAPPELLGGGGGGGLRRANLFSY